MSWPFDFGVRHPRSTSLRQLSGQNYTGRLQRTRLASVRCKSGASFFDMGQPQFARPDAFQHPRQHRSIHFFARRAISGLKGHRTGSTFGLRASFGTRAIFENECTRVVAGLTREFPRPIGTGRGGLGSRVGREGRVSTR